jgi:hypothetical protein
MRSTVIDLPQALEHGRALAHEGGYADLVDYRASDLLTDPVKESDAALLSNVLRHLSPTQVVSVLSRVRAALRPGGTVAIWELEAPHGENAVGHGAFAALFFRLTSTGHLSRRPVREMALCGRILQDSRPAAQTFTGARSRARTRVKRSRRVILDTFETAPLC